MIHSFFSTSLLFVNIRVHSWLIFFILNKLRDIGTAPVSQ